MALLETREDMVDVNKAADKEVVVNRERDSHFRQAWAIGIAFPL